VYRDLSPEYAERTNYVSWVKLGHRPANSTYRVLILTPSCGSSDVYIGCDSVIRRGILDWVSKRLSRSMGFDERTFGEMMVTPTDG
jgi:hypothetical protein